MEIVFAILFVFGFYSMAFATLYLIGSENKSGKIYAILCVIGFIVVCLATAQGVFYTTEVLDSDVLISNDSLRAISSGLYVEDNMNGRLFVTSCYIERKPTYTYYCLMPDGTYQQKNIPADVTKIKIDDNTPPCVITYADNTERVYLGFIHDFDTIKYDNFHYLIIIPENGLSNEIYLE